MSDVAGLTSGGVVTDASPIRPCEEQTAKYRSTDSLTRSSVSAAPRDARRTADNLARSSSKPAPAAPLARVSANNFPNLNRASALANAAANAPGTNLNRLSRMSANSAGRPNLGRSSVMKTMQELGRIQAPESVHVTIGMMDKATQKPVAYKNDGARFQLSRFTLKLIEGHTYAISLQLKEEVQLMENLGQLSFVDDAGTPSVEAVAFEGDNRNLVGTWTCRAAACTKGARRSMELRLMLEEIGQATLPLNVKVYSPGDRRHGESGLRMRSIIADFKVVGGDAQLRGQQWISE